MRFISFDTETTGLRPGQICQLSYIIDNAGTAMGKNYFFAVRSIEPGASNVHGFTVPVLDKLSQGMGFAHHAEAILTDFESADLLLAHNFSFDHSFLVAEFNRTGKKPSFPRQLCTMRHFTPFCKLPSTRSQGYGSSYKYPSLTELTRFFGITDKMVSERSKELFNLPHHVEYHDARVDSTAVYLCYKKAVASGMIE